MNTAAALQAARAVAVAVGVACDDAVVIGAGSNVIVHLKPAPLVARVMTGTVVLHDDVGSWLEREIAVGAFAAQHGALVVAPSHEPPPGPYQHDGIWMSLWGFVPHDDCARQPEARELGDSLRALHAVLAEYRGDLAPLSGIGAGIERLLGELRPSGGLTQEDIDRMASQLRGLMPAVFEPPLPGHALHGDASFSNLLRVDGHLIWNDFEDVCSGPVEWDVSSLVADARARGCGRQFVDDLLSAYSGPGLEDLSPFLDAHALYTTAWQAFDLQRRAKEATPPRRTP